MLVGLSTVIRFILAPCGLGIRNEWAGLDLSGTLDAPASILSSSFITAFPDSQVVSLPAVLASSARLEQNYFSDLGHYFAQCLSVISTSSPFRTLDVLLGGDHSVAFPSVCAKLKGISSKKLGLILLDSHGELHQPSTSPSGNFHGMWLRALVDVFEDGMVDSFCPEKLPTENVFIIGNLHLEREEQEFISRHGIRVISEHEFVIDKGKSVTAITDFCRSFEHVHISLDLDIVRGESIAVNLPEAGGMAIDSLFDILDSVPFLPSFSCDIVEVNIRRSNAAGTVDLARRLIKKLISISSEKVIEEGGVVNL